MSNESIIISVRNIVEFVLRRGSIDSGYMSPNRALEGTRAHQRHARGRKKQAALLESQYESEVSMKHSFRYKEFDFRVEGRADGVLKKDGQIWVEEVKSTTRPVGELEKNPVHLAQLKMYGYMYCLQQDLEEIQTMLTYINIENDETVSFEEQFTFDEIEEFFFQIIEKYYVFAKTDHQRIQERIETAQNLRFPHESYRAGQREFAVAVYKTIRAGKKLFAQAPTGTGKTISAIFPAVKALGEGLAGKIFYVTARTITRTVAEDSFRLMERAGLKMRVVTITAKDKICFCQERICEPTACAYADGHFDRINGAILDLITKETILTREIIEAYGEKHGVCPYELSLDAAYFCDGVICDYNYVYDPVVALKRFFAEGQSNDFIILCDEAHNFVERSREMFSAALDRDGFVAFRKSAKGVNNELYRVAGKISNWLLKRVKEYADGDLRVNDVIPEELKKLLWDFDAAADKVLAERRRSAIEDELREINFSVIDFLRKAELFDERYIFHTERGQGRNVVVKLLCLDPSYLLSKLHKSNGVTVLFSATFTPLNYFRDALGGGPEDFGLILPSPFPKKNLKLVIDCGVPTVYRRRREGYESICQRLYALSESRRGNYLVFFSSYEYLGAVLEMFVEKYPSVEVQAQTPGMKEEDKEGFLARFTDAGSILGFVVMGGIFSEGIDLAGERLIGAVVVGVGMPMLTPERGVIADYYSRVGLNGFNYAYVYPGMNKVMQAAGRVIRSETDRGVVLLIDGRFVSALYQSMFPEEWRHFTRISKTEELQGELAEFWGGVTE